MLGRGSNGFRCDWRRAAVRSFVLSRSISVALVIGIGNVLRKPVYGVVNVCGVCHWCPHIVTSVVVKAGLKK